MKQTKEISKYSAIWFYTTNNPCMMRMGNMPCMYELIFLSLELGQDYGIKMYIGFSKFYIMSTHMKKNFKSSKEFDSYRKQIIEASHHLNGQIKFPVKFIQPDFNYIFKEFMRILPEDKKIVVSKNKIKIPQSLDSLTQTSEEWTQTITEIAEQLTSEMREKIGDSSEMTPVYDQLYFMIIEFCNKKVNNTKLLNEEFHDLLKEQVVQYYLKEYQGLKHCPVFFMTDILSTHEASLPCGGCVDA